MTCLSGNGPGRPRELQELDNQSHRLPCARLLIAYLCFCLAYIISYLDMNYTVVSLPTIADALHTAPSIT